MLFEVLSHWSLPVRLERYIWSTVDDLLRVESQWPNVGFDIRGDLVHSTWTNRWNYCEFSLFRVASYDFFQGVKEFKLFSKARIIITLPHVFYRL